MKYLDYTGLTYLWTKIKGLTSISGQTITVGSNSITVPNKTSQLTNDSGFITTADIPEGSTASTTVPLMDGTATIGTELAFARGDHRHPTDTTRVAANAAITGATKTKITYDSKGLVTAGADLTASDIPSLTLSKITDVTASASELNVLDGITASTTELNYVDGVTSAIQTQINGKISNSEKGLANGVCPLNATSKIDATYLPSYVDDVVEAYIRSGATALGADWLATGSASGTTITPESGVIYVIMNGNDTYPTNSQYRWGSSLYVKLNDGGVTSITNSEIDTIVAN